ncbi:aldo/keto reductase [Leucothrix mucor]|uniref:aldo/keto reductase n=1 Tax=Leucothrix mucor TaxID=45248 RepID=UPI0003B72E85|nr:aldo/keto reductase [Leucothrix mucor]
MQLLKNKIGNTGLEVTQLSFGGASLGNLAQAISDQQAQAVLSHAWDAEINYFDTAPHYGRGLSEQRLGQFLSDKPRTDYVISTKVGRVLSPGKPMSEADGFVNPLPNNVRYDYSAKGIRENFESSCERLQTDYIDILYVHDIGVYTHGEAENARHMHDFLTTGADELKRLKAEGKIAAFGLGVNETQVCVDIMKQVPLDVILIAGRLSLLDRSAEMELTGLCREMGTSLVLGGIFNSGILATGAKAGATYDYGPAPEAVLEAVRELEVEASEAGLSIAEAALQFAMNHPSATSVLLGTGDTGILQLNLDAAQKILAKAAD